VKAQDYEFQRDNLSKEAGTFPLPTINFPKWRSSIFVGQWQKIYRKGRDDETQGRFDFCRNRKFRKLRLLAESMLAFFVSRVPAVSNNADVCCLSKRFCSGANNILFVSLSTRFGRCNKLLSYDFSIMGCKRITLQFLFSGAFVELVKLGEASNGESRLVIPNQALRRTSKEGVET
jgi:hypothetical protein